ncbi:hypothetical protein SPRG_14165, partial [Saprolegnia parasitica CBS 223.65]
MADGNAPMAIPYGAKLMTLTILGLMAVLAWTRAKSSRPATPQGPDSADEPPWQEDEVHQMTCAFKSLSISKTSRPNLGGPALSVQNWPVRSPVADTFADDALWFIDQGWNGVRYNLITVVLRVLFLLCTGQAANAIALLDDLWHAGGLLHMLGSVAT